MIDSDRPLRRLIIAADVQRYSERDALDQVDAQAGLVYVLGRAATEVGLDRDAWYRQQQGDGEVAILPADVDEPSVVADFVRELGTRLARHNRALKPELRLRLRVAVHSGTLHVAANGYGGTAPVNACRLRDAQQVKDALAAVDGADLALIVSGEIYRDIVQPGYRGLRPEEFHRVDVSVKQFAGDGYVQLPGFPVASWRAATTNVAAAAARRSAEASDRPTQAYDFGGAHIAAVTTSSGDAVAGDKLTSTVHQVGGDVRVGGSPKARR